MSHALPRRNGDLLGRLQAPEGKRWYALFTWAPGDIIETDNMTTDQARTVGRTLAGIHRAADRYVPRHCRYALGEGVLLDRPLQQLKPYLAAAASEDVRFIINQVAQIRARLRAFDPSSGGWGIIHGDMHGRQYHFSAGGQITFFDFDHCGYGWRAYDLSYYYTRIPAVLRAPFLQGYHVVRPIGDEEYGMLPTFGRAAWIREGLRPAPLAKLLRNPYL